MTAASVLERTLTEQAWHAVTAGNHAAPSFEAVAIEGRADDLLSSFPVAEVAVASVTSALAAGVGLLTTRGGSRSVRAGIDRGHIAAAVRSEQHFRADEQLPRSAFAPLSRFWRTADGWVRTHANYPWHRDALLRALGTPDDEDSVADVMAELRAAEVERRVFAAGGVAAAVRTLDEWRTHPQGRALAAEPLIGHREVGPAPARARAPADLPADGVRVLDLTRVIAGPVCTRYLAALGAEVLRVDPPSHPDMPRGSLADTLLGKRSSLLDLHEPHGLRTLHRLLDRADVLVCGYRPGALERFGLDEQELARAHPGLVVAYLSAWGHVGPWHGRRGFDSVVQAPTGIAAGESIDGETPGALPCQLLDHGTGYLAAAAVLDALVRQTAQGGTHVRRVSLARTAWWLASDERRPTRAPGTAGERGRQWVNELAGVTSRVAAVPPPGELDGRPLRWREPVTRYGGDAPAWSSD